MLVEDNEIIDRRSEVCAIEYVEKLGPKLDVKTLRDPPDPVVLKQREIQIRKPRPNQCIATHIAPEIRGIRKSQALSLDVVVGIARIGERLAARTHEAIGRLGGLVELRPQRVPSRIGVNGWPPEAL